MNTEEAKETHNISPSDRGDNKNGLSTAAKIGIGVGIVLGLAVLILVLIFLIDNPGTTETVRDLFIIVLALESLVIGTALVILIYQLIVLTRMLRDDVKPMIESTQETLNTVKGTATFVSQQVTTPAIAASGYITGIGRALSVMVALLPRRRSASSGPSQLGAASAQGEAREGE
jgi:hypothetical protein